MQYVDHYDSPIGRMTLCADGTCLTGLWFDGQRYYGSTLEDHIVDQTEFQDKKYIFIETKKWLDRYFEGEDPGRIPPMVLQGSDFYKEVWTLLQEIPYGRTVTYGQIASAIAKKRGISRMSAQAVGGAVGHNPIAVLIPCHRVLAGDGSLTGYAGGLEKKKYLLELEGIHTL